MNCEGFPYEAVFSRMFGGSCLVKQCDFSRKVALKFKVNPYKLMIFTDLSNIVVNLAKNASVLLSCLGKSSILY